MRFIVEVDDAELAVAAAKEFEARCSTGNAAGREYTREDLIDAFESHMAMGEFLVLPDKESFVILVKQGDGVLMGYEKPDEESARSMFERVQEMPGVWGKMPEFKLLRAVEVDSKKYQTHS